MKVQYSLFYAIISLEYLKEVIIIDKISLYIINIKDILEQPLGNILNIFSAESKERIKRYRFISDQNRTAWAEILLRFLLPDALKWTEIKRDELGKPYFQEAEYHFNLSHSGEWIACTLGKDISGVDIEKEESVTLLVAEKYFSPEEYEAICSLDDLSQRRLFYQFWCIKESYLKYEGKGLSGGLKSVDCRALLSRKKKVGCRSFFLSEGYHLAVAGLSSSLPEKFIELDLQDLLSFVKEIK